MEENVRIFCRQGSGRYMISESSVQLFLARMKVSRIEERCFVNFVTPEGGVELELPRGSAVDMIESLIMMLPHEDIRALLAAMNEKL